MRLLSLMVVPLASARGVHSLQQQIPIVGEHTKDTQRVQHAADDVAPVIGVHFTISHAVAAARYPNGTIQDLAKVEGDAGYIEVMLRWVKTRESWGEDWLPSGVGLKRWKCNQRKVSRAVRGLLPVSRDAATLSSFLLLLRETLTEQLDTPVTNIAPAIFLLDQPQTQDFEAALELAGLASSLPRADDPPLPWSYDPLFVISDMIAAYAGLGYGICEDRGSYMQCFDKRRIQDDRKVLWLNFDSYSFVISLASPGYVYQARGAVDYDFYLELGHRNLPDDEVARAKFWANMHNVIVSQLTRLSALPQIWGKPLTPSTRIVLMGDHGDDAEFRAVVKTAVGSLRDVDADILFNQSLKGDGQVDRSAARGAAELGWRFEFRKRALGGKLVAADARAREL